MTVQVGNWVRRARPNTKWHLTESVVAGDAVTRCGKRMADWAPPHELQVRDDMPLTRAIGQPQLCRQCAPFSDTTASLFNRPNEDDASTPVDTDAVPE